jgi:hypothetical protein
MSKARINISIDQDLVDFAKTFAAENRTSFSEVVTQYLLALKRRVEGESVEAVMAHPAFHAAMEDAQARLRDGSAQWHTYGGVFGDLCRCCLNKPF